MSKKKTPAVPALTRLQVEAKISRIAVLQAGETSMRAETEKSIAFVNETFAKEAAPVQTELAALVDEVFRWAEANRTEICTDGTKTASFAAGEISWRTDPASVKAPTKKEKLAAIFRALAKARLKRFIRVKIELDKEAILKEPEKIKGIDGLGIRQDETIYLKPFQVGIEPVELARKSK